MVSVEPGCSASKVVLSQSRAACGVSGPLIQTRMSMPTGKYKPTDFIIADDLGTAVNVQAMVFGNMGEDCATGVCFTRDPATGKYGASVLRLVRLGGILTVLAFLSFLTISLRRERRAGVAGPELRT